MKEKLTDYYPTLTPIITAVIDAMFQAFILMFGWNNSVSLWFDLPAIRYFESLAFVMLLDVSKTLINSFLNR